MPLYARYSDLLSGDTVSVIAGTEDTAYPKANIVDRLSRTVGKFSGTSGTYRRTFGGAKTVEAAVFVNTNATAITLTNADGLSEAITIPATPEDGHRLDPWIDLRGSPAPSSAQWNVALTGPSGVGLGEFLLVETLRDIEVLWTPSPDEHEVHPVSHQETDYGVDLDYGMGVRQRSGALSVRGEGTREQILSLTRDARGRLRAWVFIPNEDRNDALFVTLAQDDVTIVPISFGTTFATEFSDSTITIKEQQKGLAL